MQNETKDSSFLVWKDKCTTLINLFPPNPDLDWLFLVVVQYPLLGNLRNLNLKTFENARLAQEKSTNAQEKDDDTLADYENKIGEYINNDRETGKGFHIEELWTGSQSSGTINLSDSIYNYTFLVVTSDTVNGSSAIITIDKTGMTKINGGSSYAYQDGDGVGYWAFNISAISEDGKQLTILRSGRGNQNTSWLGATPINRILGIR